MLECFSIGAVEQKMKKLRSLLGIVILSCLGVMTFLIWHTIHSPEEGTSGRKAAEETADLKLNRIHYVETREGMKEWELNATSASYFKEEETIHLQKVKATFFGKNEEIYSLVGEKGKFNTRTKMIEVYEGVKVDSSDGYHVQTNSLTYSADEKILSTHDPVEIRGPEFFMAGNSMIVDLNHQRLKVLGGVTTTFSPHAIQKSF
jgi:LPS export ABC transporter protein LptC